MKASRFDRRGTVCAGCRTKRAGDRIWLVTFRVSVPGLELSNTWHGSSQNQ